VQIGGHGDYCGVVPDDEARVCPVAPCVEKQTIRFLYMAKSITDWNAIVPYSNSGEIRIRCSYSPDDFIPIDQKITPNPILPVPSPASASPAATFVSRLCPPPRRFQLLPVARRFLLVLPRGAAGTTYDHRDRRWH